MARQQRACTKTSDVNIRAIFGSAFGLIACRSRRSHVLVWLLFRVFLRAVKPPTWHAQYPLAAEPGDSAAARAAAADHAATGPAGPAGARRRVAHELQWVDRNAGIVRIPIEEAMRFTLRTRAACRVPSRRGKHEGRRVLRMALVIVSWWSSPASRRRRLRTDDRRAEHRLSSASRACRASAFPAPLREIGFDQNLDQRAAARCGRSGRAGTDASASATTSARSRSFWRLSTTTARCSARRCSSALDEHARRAVARRRHAISRSSTVSFDPRETPALAAAQKGRRACSGTSGRHAADGWHFLTGDQPSIDRLTKAAGFRYVWDADDAAVRASGRHHRRDA